MVLTRRERRADAVEKLRELQRQGNTLDAAIIVSKALYENSEDYYCLSMQKNLEALIDLLSEDECTDASNGIEVFECSVCGVTIDMIDEGGEPTMWYKNHIPGEPCYCPSCGSRVTYQDDFINMGNPYHPGDAVLDAGVISSKEGRDDTDGRLHSGISAGEHSDSCADDGALAADGLDSREKLEADIRSKPTHIATTLAWPPSANDVKEMLWSVSVEEAIGWLDRQAEITAREWRLKATKAMTEVTDERDDALKRLADCEDEVYALRDELDKWHELTKNIKLPPQPITFFKQDEGPRYPTGFFADVDDCQERLDDDIDHGLDGMYVSDEQKRMIREWVSREGVIMSRWCFEAWSKYDFNDFAGTIRTLEKSHDELLEERDEWQRKAEQAMESYQDAKQSRDNLTEYLGSITDWDPVSVRRILDMYQRGELLRDCDRDTDVLIETEHMRNATADMVEEMWRKLQVSVELPVDADGVPCRIGDAMDFIGHMTVDATDGHNVFFFADNWSGGVYCESASELHHYHHAPAVADVLRNVVTLCHSIWRERDECWDVDSIMDSGNMRSFIEDIEKIRTKED